MILGESNYEVPTLNHQVQIFLLSSEVDTIWLFNTLPWYRWPIEIDSLPFLKMGGFSMANC